MTKKQENFIDWMISITVAVLFVLCAFFYCPSTYADGIQRQGNTFVAKQSSTTAGKTQYTYKDTDGKVYPIYAGTRGGYYIIKTSKDGKQYKKYLPEVKKALGK